MNCFPPFRYSTLGQHYRICHNWRVSFAPIDDDDIFGHREVKFVQYIENAKKRLKRNEHEGSTGTSEEETQSEEEQEEEDVFEDQFQSETKGHGLDDNANWIRTPPKKRPRIKRNKGRLVPEDEKPLTRNRARKTGKDPINTRVFSDCCFEDCTKSFYE